MIQPPVRVAKKEGPKATDSTLPRCDALLLQVLTQHGAMGLHRVAMLAGYPPRASTARNALGRLRSLGYIEGNNTLVSITPLGRKNCAPFEPLPKTASERLNWWLTQLPAVDAAMLKVIASRYPRYYTLDLITVAAGYETGKSTTRNAAGRLRTLGLIEGSNSALVAVKDLCE